MPKVDLSRVWPCASVSAVPNHPAALEVARIRDDARRLGWPNWRLDDLATYLEPNEFVAIIGETIGIARAAGDVHRYFSRRPHQSCEARG